MRIRHVLPAPEMGVLPVDWVGAPLAGIVNSTLQLATQQAREGHDVEIVCPIEQKESYRDTVAGVQVYWIPLWNWCHFPRYDFRYIAPLLLFSLKGRPVDVTHVHNMPYHLVQVKSRAAILHYHGEVVRNSPIYDIWLGRADAVVCASDYIRRNVTATVRRVPQRLVTIYCGIDWRAYAKVDRIKARAAFGVSGDQVAILFAGRVAPEKGLHVLLEALRKTVARVKQDFVLLVAGSARLGTTPGMSDAVYQAKYPELAAYERFMVDQSSGLPVRFLGDISRDDMPSFYRMGDFLVCPSVCGDAFPFVNLEAIAAGLPLIGSDVGGIPELVKPFQNGLLFPAGDSQALSGALVQLISDVSLREKLGAAGQKMAEQFDWCEVSRQMQSVYDSVVDGGAR